MPVFRIGALDPPSASRKLWPRTPTPHPLSPAVINGCGKSMPFEIEVWGTGWAHSAWPKLHDTADFHHNIPSNTDTTLSFRPSWGRASPGKKLSKFIELAFRICRGIEKKTTRVLVDFSKLLGPLLWTSLYTSRPIGEKERW